MTLVDAAFCILLFGAVQGLVGHSFIYSFFKHKEEIINRMTEKGDL